MMDPKADSMPVEPSSHRSIVDSEPSVRGSSMNAGGGKSGGGWRVCLVWGHSSASSRVEGERYLAGMFDLRSGFLGGIGSGGGGVLAFGGGRRD
jgi:hypothetical protein